MFTHFPHLQSLRIQTIGKFVNISEILPSIAASCVNLREIVLYGLKAASKDLAVLAPLKQLKRVGLRSIDHKHFDKLVSSTHETKETALESCRQVAELFPPSVGLDLHILDGRTVVPIIYILAKTLFREAWLQIVTEFKIDLNANLIDEDRTLSHELFLMHPSVSYTDTYTPNSNSAFFWALEEDLVDLRRFNFFPILNWCMTVIDEKRAEWLVTKYLERACERYNVPAKCLLVNRRRKSVLMSLMSRTQYDMAHPNIKVIFDSLLDRQIFSINDVDLDGNTLAHHLMMGAPGEVFMLKNMEQLHSRGLDFNIRNQFGMKSFHYLLNHVSKFPTVAVEQYGLEILPEDLDGYIQSLVCGGQYTLLKSLLPFASPSHFLPDEKGIPPFMYSCALYYPNTARVLLIHRQRLGIDINQSCTSPALKAYLPAHVGQTIFTPLAVSIYNARADTVMTLLQEGADMTRVYDEGNTVLHIAAMNRRTHDIIDTLLMHLKSQNAIHLAIQVNDAGLTPYDLIKQLDEDGEENTDTSLGVALRTITCFCDDHQLQLKRK
jgi:hypothetical protein